MKKNTNEEIRSWKLKKISPFLDWMFRIRNTFRYDIPFGVKYIRKTNMKKYKNEPIVIIANHSARYDYTFVKGAIGSRRFNFVTAEEEFHRKCLKNIFKLGHCIPKKGFVPDLFTIKQILRLFKNFKNPCLAICPCGLPSISGAQRPIVPGTGKLLKMLGARVLVVRVHGSYLTSPRYNIAERPGCVEVELEEFCSPEELICLSPEELDSKMNEALYTDDYEWNKVKQYSYKCKSGNYAQDMEQILYKCPKCGKEFTMQGRGNIIICKECGNGATLDDKYNLVPIKDSVIPVTPREWFDWERREVRRAVKDPDFCLTEHAVLGKQPDYGYVKEDNLTAYSIGDGIIRLDKDGFSYKGTRDGKPWELFIPRQALYTTIMNDDCSYFCTNASGEFLQFVPDRLSSLHWSLAIEEISRVYDGFYKHYPWFDYDAECKTI